jgi:uncharacterized protein YecE (DUF72 family)
MQTFVGTSGWAYDWNEGGNLDWFIGHAGLNAVELNASFYRFPYRNQILSWAKKGKNLHWAVKVHRSVTHTHRFNKEAEEIWGRFRDAFVPLDPFIDFYLFQAPPRFADAGRVIAFAEAAGLEDRFAFEIRNAALLCDDDACHMLQEQVTLVSVDSPDICNRIFPGRIIYLRMHGREGWYSHDYPEKELLETAELLRAARPGKVYVFFNNDHAMLANAQLMRRVLEQGSPSGAL